MLKLQAKTYRDVCLKTDNSESAQEQIRLLDSLLKEIAEAQNEIGALRKAAGLHVQELRQASPKGKPAEGLVREINGRTYVYTLGRFVPLETKPPGA
jgi:hypothetical protein